MEKPCCESHGNTTDKEKRRARNIFEGDQKPHKQATVSSLHVCDIKLMIPGE